MKVNKKALINEITEKIKICEKYQATNPDPLAAQRVAQLEKNPCQDGKFYVVLTYSKAKPEESDELRDRLKHISYHYYTIPDWYMEEVYDDGCIIEYSLEEQKVKITKVDDFYDLLKKLINFYIEQDGVLIKKYEPKEAMTWRFGINNFLAHDYDKYKSTYKKIIYSIAAFKDFRTSLLIKKYNANEKEVYSVTHEFSIPWYIDINYKTSTEKTVNLGVGETKENVRLLNEVTGYNDKPPEGEPVIYSSDKPKRYIFDIGEYFLKKIDVLERSDNEYISKNCYKGKEKFKYATDSSKYQVYNEVYGGSKDWKDWDTVYTQFSLFKKNIRNKTFLENAKLNNVYITNVEAYELTNYMLNRNEQYITYNYKPTDGIIKFNDSFKSILGNGKLNDDRFISCLGEPKTYVLKSKDNLFNFKKNINAKNEIYVLLDREIPSAAVGDFTVVSTEQEVEFAFNSDVTYYEHVVSIAGKNIDNSRPRDRVKINGIEYTWYDQASLIIKELDKTKLVNEGNLYDGDLDSHYKRPYEVDLIDNSYVNVKNNLFFEGKDLIKKLFEIKICYSLIPLTVTIEKKYEVRPQEGKHFGSAIKQTCDKIYNDIKKEEEQNKKAVEKNKKDKIKELEKQKKEKSYKTYEEALKNKKTKKEAEKERDNVAKEYDKKIKDVENQEQYQSPYKRVVIDVFDYDPWQVLIDDLSDLLVKFSKIQDDEAGNVSTPDAAPGTAGEEDKKDDESSDDGDTRLCTYTFPLDFLGVTSLLGLESLLSKLGFIGVPAYVSNPDGGKASVLDIAVALFNNAYRNDGLTVDKYIELTVGSYEYNDDGSIKEIPANNFYQNIVTSLKYSDIQNSMNYYMDGSILSQFTSEADLKKFQKEFLSLSTQYANDLGKLKEQYFARDVKVGISNGFAYIPTGKQITFTIGLLPPNFSIWGMDSASTIDIMTNANSKYKNQKEYNEWLADLLELNKIHLNPALRRCISCSN